MNNATIQRFWSKVNKTESCWLWTASRRAKGYGAFVWTMENGTTVQGRAHRFAWELVNGPIPDGLCVLHKCDVPACVRPDHLFLGTKRDNNEDMHKKGRAIPGNTHCRGRGKYPRGESHPGAKLSADIVREIRQATDKSCGQLARQYGVGRQAIARVRAGQTWQHVQ